MGYTEVQCRCHFRSSSSRFSSEMLSLPLNRFGFLKCLNFLTDECVSDHSGRITVPYRPTDDEVVYSKRLGNEVLVDLNRSNPLTVI